MAPSLRTGVTRPGTRRAAARRAQRDRREEGLPARRRAGRVLARTRCRRGAPSTSRSAQEEPDRSSLVEVERAQETAVRPRREVNRQKRLVEPERAIGQVTCNAKRHTESDDAERQPGRDAAGRETRGSTRFASASAGTTSDMSSTGPHASRSWRLRGLDGLPRSATLPLRLGAPRRAWGRAGDRGQHPAIRSYLRDRPGPRHEPARGRVVWPIEPSRCPRHVASVGSTTCAGFVGLFRLVGRRGRCSRLVCWTG